MENLMINFQTVQWIAISVFLIMSLPIVISVCLMRREAKRVRIIGERIREEIRSRGLLSQPEAQAMVELTRGFETAFFSGFLNLSHSSNSESSLREDALLFMREQSEWISPMLSPAIVSFIWATLSSRFWDVRNHPMFYYLTILLLILPINRDVIVKLTVTRVEKQSDVKDFVYSSRLNPC